MKKFLIITGFILGNFSILLISFLILTVYTTKSSTAVSPLPLEIVEQSFVDYNVYAVAPTVLTQKASISARDARIDLVDSFFRRYNSPMYGLARDIILSADRYQIPYGYLPAIAACEGALGRRIPQNSYNTWGWGIYGGKITSFPSWQYAIDAVSKGLKAEYFAKGLDTPEKIMAKYTPPSQGSWAICVNKYLEELL